MKAKTVTPGARKRRGNKLIQERVHDSYKAWGKPAEPTVCPQCGAVFQEGRWQWLAAPAAAHRQMCPACHRIHDDFPAGFVTLAGDFIGTHRDELVRLIRNLEAREKGEHPLQRIMKITDQNGDLLVTTTDIHLARLIGEGLQHAYRGKLDFHYLQEQNLLRVRWSR